jgi:hypothetical protein
MVDAGEGFGMAGKEEALGGEDVEEPFDEALLGGFVEVDHDVATEDEVEGAVKGPGFDEVEMGEADHLADDGCGFDDGRVFGMGIEEVPELRGDGDGAAAVVEAFAGGLQDAVGDIGGEDTGIGAAPLGGGGLEEFLDDHGNGVGFFAGGAGGGPTTDDR